MVRDMLRAGPRPYRCAKLLDLNTLCGAPKQRALLFALPTIVAFPEREATVSQRCSEHPSVQFGWCKYGKLSPASQCWLDQRWGKWWSRWRVGRKPGLGCMKVQVGIAKMKVKLEQIVPVQDRTENPVIIVECVRWYLWRNLMGCDIFLKYVFDVIVFLTCQTHCDIPCCAKHHIQSEGFTTKEDEKGQGWVQARLSPGACHVAMPQGGLLETLAVFDLLLHCRTEAFCTAALSTETWQVEDGLLGTAEKSSSSLCSNLGFVCKNHPSSDLSHLSHAHVSAGVE